MDRTRLGLGAASALFVGLFVAAVGGHALAAKEKSGPHLRYAKTYAEAVMEAKDRNAVIFATFHKDK